MTAAAPWNRAAVAACHVVPVAALEPIVADHAVSAECVVELVVAVLAEELIVAGQAPQASSPSSPKQNLATTAEVVAPRLL